MALYLYRIAGGVLVGLLPLAGARAQARPQLSWSAGPAYSLTSIKRSAGTPSAFRADDAFGPGGELRLAWPLAPQWALETALGLTELQPGIGYRTRNSKASSGIGTGPVWQTGLALRRLDLLTLGARLSLDATLGAAAAWLARPYPTGGPREFNPGQRQPAPGRPLTVYTSSQRNRSTWLLNGGVRLRYALAPAHSLLLSLDYWQGLRPLVETRTQRLAYLAANGTPQEGGFVLRDRGSRAALQLGYGWFLGRSGERAAARTPRYGRLATPPEDEAADETPTLSEPPTE
ncbi:hypothetical protein [Hymenobacter actinosclerus]|uniref:Outer membrane protein beta-barrel domain-containing protein n=1 Tax=Hymenobacter actinosclerus TaxID=82805 RepID=A0A1I0H3N8_9BACT|nr:hypothetical protein [Hymenobacter actinosclerus]SET77446.1 hypothetical protein SAMN04487998_2707 [Hymenobacter actinosclerus]